MPDSLPGEGPEVSIKVATLESTILFIDYLVDQADCVLTFDQHELIRDLHDTYNLCPIDYD